MAKVFTIPVPPKIGRKRRERTTDPRYVDGQRLLVEAMKYLAQSDPISNRRAIALLSDHVRTRFRIRDSPLGSGSGLRKTSARKKPVRATHDLVLALPGPKPRRERV